jgi:transcriptional regulator with XRE-family HTH domain
MNLNQGASEIAMPVHDGERYKESMSDPETDDRGEALAWYFRLLVKQEIERGTKRKDLLKKFGIQKGHLSQIERGKLGIGIPKLVQFATVFGYSPGEMLDRALSWWEAMGRAERAQFLLEEANKAVLAAHESGEHPSQSPQKAAR